MGTLQCASAENCMFRVKQAKLVRGCLCHLLYHTNRWKTVTVYPVLLSVIPNQRDFFRHTSDSDTAWHTFAEPEGMRHASRLSLLTVALSSTLMEKGSATLCLRRACSSSCSGGRSHFPNTTRSMSLEANHSNQRVKTLATHRIINTELKTS